MIGKLIEEEDRYIIERPLCRCGRCGAETRSRLSIAQRDKGGHTCLMEVPAGWRFLTPLDHEAIPVMPWVLSRDRKGAP